MPPRREPRRLRVVSSEPYGPRGRFVIQRVEFDTLDDVCGYWRTLDHQHTSLNGESPAEIYGGQTRADAINAADAELELGSN